MKILLFLFPFLFAAAAENNSLPLVDIFSTEKNPGRGSMDYVKGTETETIAFGAEAGHYILGMVFGSDTLPEAIQADFKGKEVIQLAFGTSSKNTAGKVAQFGAATLMVAKSVKKERFIPLRVPGSSDAPLPESGLLLFTSPSMAQQLSDEEKLKGTFFSKSGSITLSASSTPKTIQVTAAGKKMPFKMQAMRMEIQATLTTPFNSDEHQLHTTPGALIEFPLYWPENAAGKKLAMQLSENSFNAKNAVKVPEDAGRRQILSKPSEPAAKKRKAQ